MKRLSVPLAIAAVFFYSCQDENVISRNTDLQLTFDIPESDARLPEKILADVILKNTTGALTTNRVGFTRTGSRYVSEPLGMQPGSYTLSEFLVVDRNLSASFTSSEHFVINGDRTSAEVSLGRLQLQNKRKNSLLISVYTHDGTKKHLTDAKVTIYHEDTGERYEYMLAARTNRIEFEGNPEEWYYIVIEKQGYAQYFDSFSYRWLASKRMDITLQTLNQKGAISFQPSATCFYMRLQFEGQGTVTLDWGKGEIEVINFNVDPADLPGTAYHYSESCYAISLPPAQIAGDVQLITGITFESSVDALHLEYATGMRELSITEPYLEVLDLKTNNELKALTIMEGSVHSVILPQQHAIRTLTLVAGYDWPTADQVNTIIDNIHMNAVAANITGGSIALISIPVPEQAAIKLAELVNTYNWTVQY